MRSSSFYEIIYYLTTFLKHNKVYHLLDENIFLWYRLQQRQNDHKTKKNLQDNAFFNLENNIINNNAGKKSVCFQYHYLKSKSCFLEKT